jgi:hypothetical protein
MRRYVGPCQHCGIDIDRTFRPGRESLCIECSIRKSAEHCTAIANGTHPSLERHATILREEARQIKAQEGPMYERWMAGRRRAIAAEFGVEV